MNTAVLLPKENVLQDLNISEEIFEKTNSLYFINNEKNVLCCCGLAAKMPCCCLINIR